MKENYEHLFDVMKKTALTAEERNAMKAELRLFMAAHPVRETLFARALAQVEDAGTAISDALAGRRFLGAQSFGFAFALVLFVAVGTSFAAEGALPGNALYTIKTRVNEPLLGAFNMSQEAKARWSVALATRRLEEAESLAVRGELTLANLAQLQENFESETSAFDASVASLAGDPGGAQAIAQAQSDLEVSLQAHAEVLAALGEQLPRTKSGIRPILENTLARAKEAGRARADAEGVVAVHVGKTMQAAAVEKRTDAESKLEEVRAALNATTSSAASAGVSNAAQAIGEGETKFDAGEYGQAFSNFQEAIRSAQRVDIGLRAQERLSHELEDSEGEKNDGSRGGSSAASTTQKGADIGGH